MTVHEFLPVGDGESGVARPGTGRAEAEQLEAVGVDLEPGPTADLGGDGLDPGIVDVVGAATAGADDVVVVDGFARDVGVLARRQVEPLDDAKVLEQIERPEDRGPSDPEAPGPSVGDQVGGGEVPGPVGDQLGHGTAGSGDPVSGMVECAEERALFGHAPMILGLSSVRRHACRPVRPATTSCVPVSGSPAQLSPDGFGGILL